MTPTDDISPDDVPPLEDLLLEEDVGEQQGQILWCREVEHYHRTPEGVTLLESDVDRLEEHPIMEAYESGVFESASMQVTLRNNQALPIEVADSWEGNQLHLDVTPTETLTLSTRSGLLAISRYWISNRPYLSHLLFTGVLLALTVACVMGLFALFAWLTALVI